jgi:branched-chain amino acid transport system permease protein
MVVLGGMGSITGAILGAAILAGAPEALRVALGEAGAMGLGGIGLFPADLLRQLLYALLLIILMLRRPQGIFGAREVSLRGLFQRRRRDLGAPPAERL